jgi:hypothetical protein
MRLQGGPHPFGRRIARRLSDAVVWMPATYRTSNNKCCEQKQNNKSNVKQ